MNKLILLLIGASLSGTLLGQVTLRKTSALQSDADANGKINPGDTLRYTITITNISGTNLLNAQFSDTNFPNQTLVAGSIKSTPIARPDAYAGVIGNTRFNVPATSGVLTNDSDPDGDAISVVAFSAASAHGGTVIVTNNGGFEFLPPVGYQGTDMFSYTISDGNGGSNTATVTLAINNMVWYVNNALGVNGDGRQPTPFNSINPVNGAGGSGDADGANDFIYLFTGSGSYGSGLALESGQRLVGAGVALVVGGATIYPAGSRPTLGLGGGGVICAANNTIQGLNINATAGKGITGTNVGALTLNTLAVASTNGAAVDLDTGTLAVTPDSLICASSPAEGIRLNNVNGLFNVSSGGSVANTVGPVVRLTGGAANVTFPGTLSKTSSGQIVDIQARTGGAITFGGSITASASSSGILVQNCAGGTITLSGASKTLSTGANAGVSLVNNPGTTINFLNGGLVIATTTGIGFNATGGATAINVSGPSNTINSATATALNVANTTIGTGGLTFQRVTSSGGSATGIILDNTGTSGGLTVTGTGSAGSGGTIANKTGVDGDATTGIGVYMNNSGSNAFSWMQINDCQNFGIRGSSVTSVTLSNLVVNGANGTSTAGREGSVIFDNAFGACALVNSTVRGAIEDNFRVENDTGTLTSFLVSGCTIGNNSTVSGNIGARLAAKVSAVMTATVRNCTFQGNRTDSINCDAGDSSTLTISILTNTIIAGASGNNQGNLGIEVTTALNGHVNFNIDGNKIGTDGVTPQPLINTGINVFNGTLAGGTPAFMSGTVRGNTVVNAGAGQSGFGIRVFNQGYGTIAANISGNNVSNVGLDYGLLVEASSNSGTANAPGTNTVGVTGNTVNVLSGALDAIRLQARGRGVINARINSNSSSGGGAGFRGLEIRQASQTIPAGGTTYTATFNLEGLPTGLQSNYNTIVSYLQSQNPSITVANCDTLFVTGITGVPSVIGIP